MKKKTTKKKKAVKGRSRARNAERSKTSNTQRESTVASRVPLPTAKQQEAAKRKYFQGIVERGEMAPKGAPLPPGATHEIVGHDEEGTPDLKRKRYSLL